MADTIFEIDPDGTGDYNSLNAGLADNVAEITAGNRIIFDCFNSSGTHDTTAVTIPAGYYGAGELVIRGKDGVKYLTTLPIAAPFEADRGAGSGTIRLEDIWFNLTPTADWEGTVRFDTCAVWEPTTVFVDRCAFIAAANTYRTDHLFFNSEYWTGIVRSCLFVNPSTASQPTNMEFGNPGTRYVYSNTFVGNAAGTDVKAILLDGNTADMYNNIFYNMDVEWGTKGGETITENYNASSVASASSVFAGLNDRSQQTFTFVDASNYDYTPAEGDTGAKGFGVDMSSGYTHSFSFDYNNTTRTGTWDIGAFQSLSANKYTNYYYYNLLQGVR